MIDSHVHVASADVNRYPRRARDTAGWWDGPMGVEELLGQMDLNRVARAVLVHSVGVYGFDCRSTIDAAALHPERLAAVAAVDIGRDPADQMAELAKQPTVRTVRLMAIEPWGTSWVREEVAGQLWHLAATHGLMLLVVAGGPELAALRPVIAANPDVTTVIDNAGMASLDAAGRVPRQHPVLALAELGNVCVKVFTPLLLAASANGTPGRVLEQLVGAYGAERVAWGSNYPQTASLSYGNMVALARQAASALGASAEQAVLEATSARLWFDG